MDGSTWQLASASDGTFTEPDNQYVASVVATPTGLVAVGSETSNSASIWTSENGTEWRRVSNADGIFGNDHGSCFRCPGVGDYVMANDVTVNPAGTKVVAVGQESRVGRAAIWIGR